MVQMLYTNTSSFVRCIAGLSYSFPVKVGVHEGSELAPLLFILIMDTIIKEPQQDISWILLYDDDDDVILAATTTE